MELFKPWESTFVEDRLMEIVTARLQCAEGRIDAEELTHRVEQIYRRLDEYEDQADRIRRMFSEEWDRYYDRRKGRQISRFTRDDTKGAR